MPAKSAAFGCSRRVETSDVMASCMKSSTSSPSAARPASQGRTPRPPPGGRPCRSAQWSGCPWLIRTASTSPAATWRSSTGQAAYPRSTTRRTPSCSTSMPLQACSTVGQAPDPPKNVNFTSDLVLPRSAAAPLRVRSHPTTGSRLALVDGADVGRYIVCTVSRAAGAAPRLIDQSLRPQPGSPAESAAWQMRTCATSWPPMGPGTLGTSGILASSRDELIRFRHLAGPPA